MNTNLYPTLVLDAISVEWDCMLEDLDRLMVKSKLDALVVQGNAFENPDIFWLTGFRSPDSIIYLKNVNEEPIVASLYHTLERITKESFIKKTHDLNDVYLQLLKENKRLSDSPDVVYGSILKELFAGKVIGVPDHIPARVLLAIQSLGYQVKAVPKLILEARATKSTKEIRTITKAGKATTQSISNVVEMIKDSKIGPNKKLQYKNSPLTVQDIKSCLDHSLLDYNAESAEDAIVAVGKKGFDWHYLGKSKDAIKAGVPIILDVFPRLKMERYVADVTRTVVKGMPNKKLQSMFDAVHDACNATVDTLTAGTEIEDVNMACYGTLQQHGFDSFKLNPKAKEGMTHGLGHGIGLEVHELPSLYSYKDHLQEGNVFAIEPGVYLKAIGGVRIENDYVVTKKKAKRLTRGIEDILFV
jgi:Xaa-Pro aminopeptidase